MALHLSQRERKEKGKGLHYLSVLFGLVAHILQKERKEKRGEKRREARRLEKKAAKKGKGKKRKGRKEDESFVFCSLTFFSNHQGGKKRRKKVANVGKEVEKRREKGGTSCFVSSFWKF